MEKEVLKLAQTIVHYACEIQSGDAVTIDV